MHGIRPCGHLADGKVRQRLAEEIITQVYATHINIFMWCFAWQSKMINLECRRNLPCRGAIFVGMAIDNALFLTYIAYWEYYVAGTVDRNLRWWGKDFTYSIGSHDLSVLRARFQDI